MSHLDKRVNRALLCVYVAVASVGADAAYAEVVEANVSAASSPEQSEKTVSLRNANDKSAQGAAAPTVKNTVGVLKCWQHGHLVYEVPGVQSVDKGAKVVRLPKGPSSDSAVQVLDMQSGLCIVETKTR